MPKYYCDYCDTHLTHDSPSVRKTHQAGRRHKDNVKFFYQSWMEEQAQKLVDQTTAAFRSNNLPFAMPPPRMMPPGVPPGMMPPHFRPGMMMPPMMMSPPHPGVAMVPGAPMIPPGVPIQHIAPPMHMMPKKQ